MPSNKTLTRFEKIIAVIIGLATVIGVVLNAFNTYRINELAPVYSSIDDVKKVQAAYEIKNEKEHEQFRTVITQMSKQVYWLYQTHGGRGE